MANTVSNVTLMTEPVFETTHNFKAGPIERQISFTCFNHGVFKIFGRKEKSSVLGSYLSLTVTQEGDNPVYHVRIDVTGTHNRLRQAVRSKADVNKYHPTSKPLLLDNVNLDHFVTIKMEFEVESGDRRNLPNSLVDDLKPFLQEGPKVTLVGSNGQITVPKILLQLRSPALKAMFSHDVQENESLTVDMKDYGTDVLQSFCDFLLTDEMDDDSDKVIGLYILADKYDVKGLKQQAEDFLLRNIEDFDRNEVFEVMLKIGHKRLKRLFDDHYPH